jgi:hypothetical protein
MTKTSKGAKAVGRAGPWSKEQSQLIEQLLPAWHEFSLVENKGLDGRDAKLIEWKKHEAEKLLRNRAFEDLPDGVSLPVTCRKRQY